MNNSIQTLVILIPGNPSVPGIYDSFLHSVVIKLAKQRKRAEGIVLPHLGQCNTHFQRIKKINLFDVVAEHKKNILSLIEHYQMEEVILIGHSLGGAITLILKDELCQVIDYFIFLCPFLGPSERNYRYLRLFKNTISRLGLKYGSYAILLNQHFAIKFFTKWLGENPNNKNIINQIKKPNYIHNFFTLVSGYFHDFDQVDLNNKLENIDPDRCFFLFAKDDFWVSEDVFQILSDDVHYTILDTISHDFCLEEAQFQEVAKCIQHYLGNNL